MEDLQAQSQANPIVRLPQIVPRCSNTLPMDPVPISRNAVVLLAKEDVLNG